MARYKVDGRHPNTCNKIKVKISLRYLLLGTLRGYEYSIFVINIYKTTLKKHIF